MARGVKLMFNGKRRNAQELRCTENKEHKRISVFSKSFLSFTLEVKCKEGAYKFQLRLKIKAFFNFIFLHIFCLLCIFCETNLFNSCVDKLVSLLMNYCGLNFREGALFSYIRAGQYVNVC